MAQRPADGRRSSGTHPRTHRSTLLLCSFQKHNEKPDSYPLMDLQAALDAARTCKAPPGKAKANEYLKRCRADMKMVGERVDVEVKMPEFHWRAYVAYHPKATAIFKGACGEILGRGVPRR